MGVGGYRMSMSRTLTSQTWRSKSSPFKLQPNGWRSRKMPREHVRKHIGWHWSVVMNNHTAFAKTQMSECRSSTICRGRASSGLITIVVMTLLNDQNRSQHAQVMWEQRKSLSMDRPIRGIQTTGNVVNHCAVAEASYHSWRTGPSCEAFCLSLTLLEICAEICSSGRNIIAKIQCNIGLTDSICCCRVSSQHVYRLQFLSCSVVWPWRKSLQIVSVLCNESSLQRFA